MNGFVRAAAGLRGADFFTAAISRSTGVRLLAIGCFAVLLVGEADLRGEDFVATGLRAPLVAVETFLGADFCAGDLRVARLALVGAFFAAACFAGLRIFVCFAVAVFDVELLRADDGMVAADVFFAVFLPDFVPVDFGGAFFVVAFFAVLFAAALRLLLVFVMAMESSSKKEARNPVGKAARLALQPSQCAGMRRAH